MSLLTGGSLELDAFPLRRVRFLWVDEDIRMCSIALERIDTRFPKESREK